MTAFEKLRREYQPRYPTSLENMSFIKVEQKQVLEPEIDDAQKKVLKELFPKTYGQSLLTISKCDAACTTTPLKIGVVLSGGQAPGGHNVICGICDGAFKVSENSKLIGFLNGPGGIIENKYRELTPSVVKDYLNTGGFDMLASGRTKLESTEQFQQCEKVLKEHGLDTLVIIGGDDSNTNSALLAEYFKQKGSNINVIGVPKTIDGDLKNDYVETSFGFYTAVRVYANLIGNIARDALSAKKYYHFIRLMGRSASRLTLDVALLTHPNVTLISEEIQTMKKTMAEIIEDIVQVILSRAEKGKNYGVVLVPEGLIEFIPEASGLIQELNKVLAENKEYIETLRGFTEQVEYINRHLSKDASYVLSTLPIDIQRELLMDRDPHGNVQVSRIETEKLLIELVEARLRELKAKGTYKGKFSAQTHFLGYEGRCAAPANFDADYAYALGMTVVALASTNVTGYMAVVKNLVQDRAEWQSFGVPLSAMMNMEYRHGKAKPVIRKSLVSLDEKPFQELLRVRNKWAVEDLYRFAEPIQYFGAADVCDDAPPTLLLEKDKPIDR